MSGARQFYYGWVVVAACFAITVTAGMGLYCYGIFFRPIEADLGWSRAAIASAFTACYIAQAPAGFVMGWFIDRYGPRPSLIMAAFFTGAGFSLCSQSNTIWDLRLFMAMAGVGLGTALPAVIATSQRWFIKTRGLVLGITMAGSGLGGLIFSPIINHLIASYGWRTTYILTGILAFVVTLIASGFISRGPEQKGLKPYGAEESVLPKAEPGLPLGKVIKSGNFFRLIAVVMMTTMAAQIVTVHFVPHARDMGITAATAATALGTMVGFATAGKFLIGLITDRFGWKKGLVVGSLGAGALCLWLLWANSTVMLYLFASLYGLFFGSLITTENGIVGHLFGTRSLAQFVGLIFGIAFLGGAFGPIIAGFLFDISDSYFFAFLLVVALFTTAGFVTLTIKPPVLPQEG